jgi:hypothetical protein
LFDIDDPDDVCETEENDNLEVENRTPSPVLMPDSGNSTTISNTHTPDADSSQQQNLSLVAYSDTETEEPEEITPMKEKKKPRKMQRNPKKWKKKHKKGKSLTGKVIHQYIW